MKSFKQLLELWKKETIYKVYLNVEENSLSVHHSQKQKKHEVIDGFSEYKLPKFFVDLIENCVGKELNDRLNKAKRLLNISCIDDEDD